MSSIWKRGKGATGAKSITIEDINKITGYDPTNTGDGKPFGTGNIQYGNKVTYFWDGTDKPYYEYGEETNKKTKKWKNENFLLPKNQKNEKNKKNEKCSFFILTKEEGYMYNEHVIRNRGVK